MGYVFSIIGFPITVCSVLGNLLTIVAVFKSRSLRLRHAYLFTTSLAFSDLMFSLLCCSVNYVTTLMDLNSINTTLCRVNGFLGVLFTLTSMFTLSLLSLDRYVAIVTPFRYRARVTAKRVKIVIACKWGFSVVIATVPLSGWGNYVFYPQKGFCFINYEEDVGVFIFIGVWFNVCFSLISYSYYHILKVARRQRRQIQVLTVVNVDLTRKHNTKLKINWRRDQVRRLKRENKSAITIFAIIAVFLISWMPFCGVNFVAAATKYSIPKTTDLICTLLVAVSSCSNPLFYGWLDSSFRSAFHRILSPILGRPRLPQSPIASRTSGYY